MINPIHILILEDNPMDAELLIRTVKKEGLQFTNIIVDNRNDFIEALNTENIDLILSDNSLPQFDAKEAVQIVRKSYPHMPFILVTGIVNEDFVISIMKLGIDDYVLKDRLTRLPSAIKSALEKKQTEKEKKQAEKKLIESEYKYRSMIERISDGFFVLDKDWNFQYVNTVAATLFKQSSDSIAGKNIWAEFAEIIGKPILDSLQQAFAKQKESFYEGYTPDFQRWLQLSVYPSPEGVVVYYRDITEKKEADVALQKGQEQYKEMVERITDGFYSLSRECRYLFLNDKACDIIKHTREEVLGKTVWEIFPDLVGSAVYNAFMKALDEQVYVQLTEHYEVTGIWKDIHVYPSKEGLSVFVSDISEKMKSEIAAKESEEVRNLIMSSALDAIVCVNHSNQFIFWNRRAEELFGWTFEEVQTKTLETTIIPKKFRQDHTQAMHRYLATGESHVAGKMLELTALNKDGKEFPIELFMIPVKTGSTKFFCAFIRDISTRKKLETKLNEQRRKSEIEKMAVALEAQEKERNFIGQELHDNINQILVGTKMMLQMINSDVEKNKHFLDNCIERLNEVIVENRKLAHEMVTPNVEQESVLTMLQTLVENMFIASNPKVTVTVEENVEEKLNTNQKLTFYRIAQEQCANIIKYSNASNVEINITTKDDKVNLIIIDNGQGMDASKKVNGIGLRNINSRLSIYNGSSEIKTAPGKGFTLVVHLPVQKHF